MAAGRLADQSTNPLPGRSADCCGNPLACTGRHSLFVSLALWGFSKDDRGWSHAATQASLHNPPAASGLGWPICCCTCSGCPAWWWVILMVMCVHWVTSGCGPDRAREDRRPYFRPGPDSPGLLVASSAGRPDSIQASLPLAPGAPGLQKRGTGSRPQPATPARRSSCWSPLYGRLFFPDVLALGFASASVWPWRNRFRALDCSTVGGIAGSAVKLRFARGKRRGREAPRRTP